MRRASARLCYHPLLLTRRLSLVRIAEIESGSIAEELSLEIGSRVVRINGERVRDGIDLTFMMSETNFELETLSPGGAVTIYEIEQGSRRAGGYRACTGHH